MTKDRNGAPQTEPRPTQLVAVTIPEEIVRSELEHQPWWNRFTNDKETWITATCSRYILVTSKEHWENELSGKYPELTSRTMTSAMAKDYMRVGNPDPFTKNKPNFFKTEGWDAYRYLLESAAGLHSHALGEEHILHQLLEQSYRNHIRIKNNMNPTWFDSVVRDIKHDARQVRKVIGPHIPPTEEETARELTNLTQGKPVLVVADNWEKAKRMVYALGRESVALKPRQIDIALISPGKGALGKMQFEIDSLHELYNSLPPTRVESMQDILGMGQEWMRDYEAVFIVSPINKHPQEERQLIHAWQECGEQRPKLVALRMDLSEEKGLIALGELKSDNRIMAILPETIGQEFDKRKQAHQALLETGRKACAMCTRLREESGGKHHPRGEHLMLPYAEYNELTKQYAQVRSTIAQVIDRQANPESRTFLR